MVLAVPRVLFFLGPMELGLLGLVLLVIVFGSRAPDIARRAGSSVSKVEESKAAVQQEIDDLKGEDLGIEEDLAEIEEGVTEVQEVMEPANTEDSPRSDDNA